MTEVRSFTPEDRPSRRGRLPLARALQCGSSRSRGGSSSQLRHLSVRRAQKAVAYLFVVLLAVMLSGVLRECWL